MLQGVIINQFKLADFIFCTLGTNGLSRYKCIIVYLVQPIQILNLQLIQRVMFSESV